MNSNSDSDKVTAAAKDVVNLLLETYRDARGVHAETVIGAAAALAGAYALRAPHPMNPGRQYVVSTEAEDLIFRGKTAGRPLTDIILDYAEAAGLARDQFPDPDKINLRAIEAFGAKSYPPISVPPANYPHEWSPNATVRLRPKVDQLLAKRELSGVESAVALAVATAELIKMTAGAIDVRTSTTLALEIMIGVSHMRPLDQEIGSAQPRPTMPPRS